MRILTRYISLRLAFGWLLVFFIMTALFSFLELVGQLDDVGEGSYRMKDAFMYVAYTLPGRVISLAAVSSLMGGIIALGTLANSDELLAMRACGFSVLRIARVVLSSGSVIMLGVTFVSPICCAIAGTKGKDQSRARDFRGRGVAVERRLLDPGQQPLHQCPFVLFRCRSCRCQRVRIQ